MSALAVLSLIAPAAPTASQGTAGEDASLFQGLLNGVQGEAAPVVPTTPAMSMKGPSGEALPHLALNDDRSAVEIGAMSVIVMTPVPPPPAADLAPVTDEASGATSVEGQDAAPTGEADAAAAQKAQTASAAMTAPALSSAPSAAPVAAQPVQTASLSEGRETAVVPPPAAAEDAVVQAALERAAPPADAVKTAQAASLLAAPAPLKPLTERSTKSLDAASRSGAVSAAGAQAAAAYAPADPAKAASPAAAPVQPVDANGQTPGSPSTPVEAAAAAVADAAQPDDAEAGARPAPLESPSAAAQAAGPREAALSTLSRVTIDATAQIAAQILRKLEGRSTRFEMSLTPDDLGRVDVKLDIDAEGRLAARLAFDNPAAAADLRGRVDELRRQLQDAGFHLADDAFEFADRDSGSSAFDRGQGGDEGRNRAFSAASRLNAETDVAQPPRWMALSLTPAGVDLKV